MKSNNYRTKDFPIRFDLEQTSLTHESNLSVCKALYQKLVGGTKAHQGNKKTPLFLRGVFFFIFLYTSQSFLQYASVEKPIVSLLLFLCFSLGRSQSFHQQ